jgi:integrase
MAGLSKDKISGTYRIIFNLKGSRKTLYAGKMEPRQASRLTEKVETLAGLLNTGGSLSENPSLHAWIREIIGTPIHEKLIKAGLVSAVGKVTLGQFIDEYIASRTDVKILTKLNLGAARRMIVQYFGENQDIRQINPADVAKFKAAMLANYADATVARCLRRGRQFFNNALDAGIIGKNPFDKIKFPSQKNPSRLFFIDRKTAAKVNEACPTAQWRLIFALARFAGLRIPSELIGLKWVDILWEQGKIRVASPKTEHLPGKDHRWVPLFPEIRKPLEESFEQAPVGETFIFPKTITLKTNLRKGLTDILKKAGVSPWPRLFQNLRASRETELAQDYPLHVVTSWIGNTPSVAIGHYLTVQDSDFSKAVGVTSTSNLTTANSQLSGLETDSNKSNTLDAKTAQNTAIYGCSEMFKNVQNLVENNENYSVFTAFIGELQKIQASRQGLEP